MAFPAALLPVAPSWYPGHMNAFNKLLPALLARTDIVLELRDTRMPLTSINPTFESTVSRWRADRRQKPGACCERIVVYGKRDLVSDWGVKPFRGAMQSLYPSEKFVFTSKSDPHAIKSLHSALVRIARAHANTHTELNITVVGMPNVGKSTLLNALRAVGIPGAQPKALRTSALPGMTRALSTRLKLYGGGEGTGACPIYAFDTPGLMMPFLGSGIQGRERAVRLALIAALKEGMYDYDFLATYLVHRLNFLQPDQPAYLPLLAPSPESAVQLPAPTGPLDAEEFLEALCARRGMLLRGARPDVGRAAQWFVQWWRENGAVVGARTRRGWGFDFDLSAEEQAGGERGAAQPAGDVAQSATDAAPLARDVAQVEQEVALAEVAPAEREPPPPASESELVQKNRPDSNGMEWVQNAMARRIVDHFAAIAGEARDGERVSATQEKKRAREEERERRRLRRAQAARDAA